MDEIDRAQKENELHLERSLANRGVGIVTVEATGFCLNCDEPLEEVEIGPEKRWCDADCRDDWEKRECHEQL